MNARRQSGALPQQATFPPGFGHRLTVAFVLVSAAASGLLAAGCLSFVATTRLALFQERSLDQARMAVAWANSAGVVPFAQLRALARQEPRFEVLVASPAATRSSAPGLTLGSVPAGLASAGVPGSFATGHTLLGGVRFLVVAAPLRTGGRLYLFFSERAVYSSLQALCLVLAVGWLAVVAMSCLLGRWIARRTLSPVQSAARAATDLAQGLLDTRLKTLDRDEFGLWARCFNQMAEQLQRTIEGLSAARDREHAFAANAAHELRTPLSVIVAAADLLEEQSSRLPAEARRAAQAVATGAGGLDRIIGDLLELSRLDAGVLTIHPGPIELQTALAVLLADSGWDDRVELVCPELWVETDWPRLERIVTNLLANAIRHGGGRVRLEARPSSDLAEVSVSDEGPGIDPVLASHVFERFFKSGAGGGTGLGLAIVQESARLLGTIVHIDSYPGEGATFWFTLARAQPGEACDQIVTDRDERSPACVGILSASPMTRPAEAAGSPPTPRTLWS